MGPLHGFIVTFSFKAYMGFIDFAILCAVFLTIDVHQLWNIFRACGFTCTVHLIVISHHWVHTFIFYPFCLIELSSSFMSLPDVFILSGRHDAIFVVGALDETVMLRGMRYHPIDIETSVVRCHRKICEW